MNYSVFSIIINQYITIHGHKLEYRGLCIMTPEAKHICKYACLGHLIYVKVSHTIFIYLRLKLRLIFNVFNTSN